MYSMMSANPTTAPAPHSAFTSTNVACEFSAPFLRFIPYTPPTIEYIDTKSVAEVSVTSNFCSWLRVTSSWMFTKSSVSLMNWSIASSSAYVLSMCAKYVSSRSSTTCKSESSWCGNSSSPNTSSCAFGTDAGVEGSPALASSERGASPPSGPTLVSFFSPPS